jgi:uncharacterized iron-regulated protein
MSYEVANHKESLGQFASNKGYGDLIEAATCYKAAAEFFRTGVTEDVRAVIKDLRDIAEKAVPDVAETAKTLAKLIKGQKIAIITDGVV